MFTNYSLRFQRKSRLAFAFAGLLIASAGLAQSARVLTPIGGHYQTLAALSPKARPGKPGLDRQQFPAEQVPEKTTYRRFRNLLLKPTYVEIPVGDFKIPEFPANSSAQTEAEIGFLRRLAETARTPEKIAECLQFADVYYDSYATPADSTWPKLRRNLFHMGRQMPWFTPDKLPLTADLMANVWSDATYYFWSLKFRYNRTRPYLLDDRLKNVSNPFFQAYPSGHASSSYVAAFVYQELLPERRALFVQNAYDMAFSREILGVHFPSDSEAGRVFARQLVNELFKNPQFKKDFAAAKAEIERVKTSSTP